MWSQTITQRYFRQTQSVNTQSTRWRQHNCVHRVLHTKLFGSRSYNGDRRTGSRSEDRRRGKGTGQNCRTGSKIRSNAGDFWAKGFLSVSVQRPEGLVTTEKVRLSPPRDLSGLEILVPLSAPVVHGCPGVHGPTRVYLPETRPPFPVYVGGDPGVGRTIEE